MGIEYTVEDQVGIITIASGTHNPISPQMHRELYDVLVRFLADENVHCGVLRGNGDIAFSAGDDMRVTVPTRENPCDQLRSELSLEHRLPSAAPSWGWAFDNVMLERHKPIIGAVRGWCLGGGLGCLLSLSDIRIAGSDAKFGFPEIAYGMGGAGGMLRLLRRIPEVDAMFLVLTGEIIDAQEARRIHLINEVVQPDFVHQRAMTLAKKIASHPPLAVRVEMECSRHAADMSAADARRYGERMYELQRLAIGDSENESFAAGRAKAR
jgi:enoyl-CoA hydratase/carnithine racemase